MLQSQRDTKSAYPKSLSQWLELDYFRRPGALRRLRSRITWAALLVSAAVMVVVLAWPGSRRTFQAGPVSASHAMFNDDCAACHTVAFRPARRLLKGDETIRSVADAACLRCHDGDVHHARQVGEASCAGCHREHRGESGLKRVEDRSCTSCHSDLKAHTDPAKPRDSDRDFRDVAAFLGGPRPHPPFFLSDHPEDPGTIRFNHKVHMDPRGVLIPGSLARETLRCTDCHEPGPDRRSMRPIGYRQDCARCHPLSVRILDEIEDGPARAAAERFRKEGAPHPRQGESSATVRALLRDRYLEFAREFPVVHQGQARPAGRPASRGRTSGTRSTIRGESEWADRQLAEASRVLFEGAGGCRYCHREAPGSAVGRDRPPTFEPPRILARWLAHGEFSHETHRPLACRECHAGASASTRTADVLMPDIATCQKCHNGKSGGARADCVECHGYHGPAKGRPIARDLAIDDLLKGPSGRPAHEPKGR